MEKIIEKISKYELFNNLLPGAVFIILYKYLTGLDSVIDNLNELEMIGLWYFIGLTVGRVGSLVVEPILKAGVGFVEYSKYISAVKKDKFITELNLKNNVYRTLISTVICVSVCYFIHINDINYICIDLKIVGIILLGVLYVMAFIKQTNYIKDRVNKALENED